MRQLDKDVLELLKEREHGPESHVNRSPFFKEELRHAVYRRRQRRLLGKPILLRFGATAQIPSRDDISAAIDRLQKARHRVWRVHGGGYSPA